MRRRPRTKYTETQKAVMWERWTKGETLHQIARLFDRPHTAAFEARMHNPAINEPGVDGVHEIRTEIEINAAPARVWSVLTDFRAHSDWNPFIKSVSGRPEKGEKLLVRIQPQGGRGMSFKPTVLIAEREKELRWLGSLLVPGLFDGEHYFLIEPRPVGGTRLVHGEKFSGLFVALAKGSLEQGTRGGFIAMNNALKERAESSSPL